MHLVLSFGNRFLRYWHSTPAHHHRTRRKTRESITQSWLPCNSRLGLGLDLGLGLATQSWLPCDTRLVLSCFDERCHVSKQPPLPSVICPRQFQHLSNMQDAKWYLTLVLQVRPCCVVLCCVVLCCVVLCCGVVWCGVV